MTNDSHTPGPWKMYVGDDDHNVTFHDTTRVSIVSERITDEVESGVSESTVAEVWPGDNDIDIRDGRLIAAAPDLLEACLRIIAVADLPLVHTDGTDTQVLGQVRDAINKALGR